MSNRTFRDIAKHGHPEDPQDWTSVDEAYVAVRDADVMAAKAYDLLDDAGFLPEAQDYLHEALVLIASALRGEQEEAE